MSAKAALCASALPGTPSLAYMSPTRALCQVMTITEIGQLLKGYNKAQTGSTKNPASFDPLATPDFFPTNIDAERQIIQFTQMSKDSYRQSTFLDRRIVRAGATTLMAEIPKLITRQTMQPLHFILHVAFCGSTLLARYLETVPRCLVCSRSLECWASSRY